MCVLIRMVGVGNVPGVRYTNEEEEDDDDAKEDAIQCVLTGGGGREMSAAKLIAPRTGQHVTCMPRIGDHVAQSTQMDDREW